MDRNTIIRLSDHPGARRRGVVLKSVKVRLPALVAARLAAAAKRHGVSQTDIIVAGLAVACPGEGSSD